MLLCELVARFTIYNFPLRLITLKQKKVQTFSAVSCFLLEFYKIKMEAGILKIV